MARCRLRYGKARRIGASLGIAERIRGALTRGGTEHRIDLLLDDGSILCLWPDGDTQVLENGWFDDERHAWRLLLSRLEKRRAR